MVFFSIFILSAVLFPSNASSGVFSFLEGSLGKSVGANAEGFESKVKNSQTMSVLESSNSPEKQKKASATIVDDNALEATSGPSGTVTEVQEKSQANKVSVYVVREGDVLSKVAEMYGVSSATIIWANDLKGAKDIKVGDELIILPISGIKHVVKKGETLKSIAAKYKGDVDEIVRFNDLGDTPVLTAGDEIIIPDGEATTVQASAPTKTSAAASSGKSNIFIRPAAGIRTQGLHGKSRSSVDIAASAGTAIYAAAGGKVIVSKSGGWNGGYGNYVVIEHSNGLQTLYAHLSSNSVSSGSIVKQGDQIGKMGSTGNSTGTHLHFEILGAKNWNPF